MRDVEQFRVKVRAYYKRQYNNDGKRYTQIELAREIGLHEDELGKRLHESLDSTTGRRWHLSNEDVLAIIRTLAKWQAITWEGAIELLEIVEYPLDSSGWKAELQHCLSSPIQSPPFQDISTGHA